MWVLIAVGWYVRREDRHSENETICKRFENETFESFFSFFELLIVQLKFLIWIFNKFIVS